MPVTAITFDPRIDLPSGNLGIQPVTLKATPTRIREDGTQTVYPETVTFSDVTGDSPIHLQSTDGTWAWTIGAYRRMRVIDIRTVFVTGATANWADLVDVDPDTFLPADPYTTVGQAIAALRAELEAGLAGGLSLTTVDAHISTAITALIGAAPGTLDTFKEVADAIGNDPGFASTIATGLAGREPAGLSAGTKASLAATYVTYDGAHLKLADTVIPISGGGGIALDTDGVPYYSSTGSTSIALDTDGVPYLAA